MDKKINYFYIDEAGHLNNDSNVFIHGCIKTDTPAKIEGLLLELEESIKNEVYYTDFVEKLNRQGFHAVENHPDIRARLYGILPTLNYRAYFVLLNKKEDFFRELTQKFNQHEIFLYSLRKLLLPRLLDKKVKKEKNIFIFEEIEFPNSTLEAVLSEFFEFFTLEYDIEYKIVGKDESNLALIDYLNYIFYCIFNNPSKKDVRMEQNFNLIKEKIGVINFLNSDTFISRKDVIEINKAKIIYGG